MFRYYDYAKAKRIIAKNIKNLERADLGMAQDFYYTATAIWEDGVYLKKLVEGTLISGIDGSRWDMPILRLYFRNGYEKTFECFREEEDAR